MPTSGGANDSFIGKLDSARTPTYNHLLKTGFSATPKRAMFNHTSQNDIEASGGKAGKFLQANMTLTESLFNKSNLRQADNTRGSLSRNQNQFVTVSGRASPNLPALNLNNAMNSTGGSFHG